MGLSATVYLISSEMYQRAVEGNSEAFNSGDFSVSYNLDKSWHAIHYLLTGKNNLGFLDGLQLEVGEEHMEVHSPEKIAKLNKQLTENPPSELALGISFTELNEKEIYPGTWSDSSDIGYIRTNLEIFAGAISEASKNGGALFVTIL